MKCFYHSADFDGICSGAIIKYKFPECEMYPINYGEEFPWDEIGERETVFMIDFSLQPFEEMVKLHLLADLRWIDHHGSAIEEYEKVRAELGQFGGSLSLKYSACELTWLYCFAELMPETVVLLGRYDVWDHDYSPDVLPFQYGMRAVHPMYLKPGSVQWESLFIDDYIEERIKDGLVVMKYEEMSNTRLMELYSFEGTFPWNNNLYSAILINDINANSQTFKSHYNRNKHELMIKFGRLPSGQWTVGLYSDQTHIDCGEIAKKLGGGGHKGAAGFQTKDLFFL